MTRFPFRASGPDFSRIVFGTWRILGPGGVKTPQDLLHLLKTCLDVGITTVDTAEIYGGYRVEEMLGQALALDSGVRRRLEIISKYGIYVPCEFHPDRRTAFYNAGGDRAVKSAEKSLRWLGVDCLDLFLVHRPDWLANPRDTADGLLRLIDAGKVKAVGVSNYNTHQFAALQQAMGNVPLHTNQVEFNPFHLDPIFDGTFDQCQLHGIRPMAWSPTGGGRLFDLENQAGERVRKALEELREFYPGITDDQFAHAWVLMHPAEPFTILGTTKPERIQSAAAAAQVKLSREHWYAITEAGRGARIP